MRLSDLIQNAIDLALKAAGFEKDQADEATREMITKIAIASIKFGDLSNLRTTDYVLTLTNSYALTVKQAHTSNMRRYAPVQCLKRPMVSTWLPLRNRNNSRARPSAIWH